MLRQYPQLMLMMYLKRELLNSFEKSIIGDRITAFDFFSEKNYTKVTEEFIHEAKEFDCDVALYDISQALRNVWIMNSIQMLFDEEVRLTSSIFCRIMLFEAIADNRELFPKEYIKNLEEYSLFSFVYYKRLKKKLEELLREKDLLLLSNAMQKAVKEGELNERF